MVRLALTGTMLLLVSACVAMNEPVKTATPESTGSPASYTSLGGDEVLSRFSTLPARQMAEGACGLFLWLRRDDAPLVFFQSSDTGSASMIFDKSEKMLTRISAERPIAFNFFEEQSFTGINYTAIVKITPEEVRSIRQGVKIESGSLSITLDDGWSAALPVAGVIGCQGN